MASDEGALSRRAVHRDRILSRVFGILVYQEAMVCGSSCGSALLGISSERVSIVHRVHIHWLQLSAGPTSTACAKPSRRVLGPTGHLGEWARWRVVTPGGVGKLRKWSSSSLT